MTMDEQILYHESQVNLYINSKRVFQVQSLECNNFGVSSDYAFCIAGIAQTPLQLSQILSQKAKIAWPTTSGLAVLHGIINEVIDFGSEVAGDRYQVRLSSPLRQLKLRRNHQVFLNKTAIEIISVILQKAGWSRLDYQIHCRHSYPHLPYSVQYNESDYEFLQRICARWGLFFLFEQMQTHACLQIYDDWQYYPAVNISLPFVTQSGQVPEFVSVFSMTCSTHWLSHSITLQGCNIMQPENELQFTKSKQSTLAAEGDWQYFGGQVQNREEGQRLASLMQRQLDWQRDIYQCCTDARNLNPGQILTLTNHPDHDFNGVYRIITVASRFAQPAGTPDFISEQATAWCSTVLLTPINVDYRAPLAFSLSNTPSSLAKDTNGAYQIPVKPIQTSPSSSLFYARIEGMSDDSTGAYLDEFGRYFLRQAFDYSEAPTGQASSSIPLVQPYGGLARIGDLHYGYHYPLNAESYVAVTHLFGDFNCPIIIGAVPNPTTPAPVTAANYTQHCLVTPTGHALIFDDKQQQQRIELLTSNRQNQLLMSVAEECSFIYLQAKQGGMSLTAKEDLHLTAQANFMSKVAKSKRLIVQNDQRVISKKSNQFYYSGGDIICDSKRDMKWQSQQSDIQITSKKDLSIKTKQNFSQLTVKGNQHISIVKGKCHLAAKTIQIRSKDILLGHDLAAIKVGPNQSVSITGTTIVLEAPLINMP